MIAVNKSLLSAFFYSLDLNLEAIYTWIGILIYHVHIIIIYATIWCAPTDNDHFVNQALNVKYCIY